MHPEKADPGFRTKSIMTSFTKSLVVQLTPSVFLMEMSRVQIPPPIELLKNRKGMASFNVTRDQYSPEKMAKTGKNWEPEANPVLPLVWFLNHWCELLIWKIIDSLIICEDMPWNII